MIEKYSILGTSIKYYLTITALYEYRVVHSGKGDLKSRASLFKSAFRIKLNNWWSTHAHKMLPYETDTALRSVSLENQNEKTEAELQSISVEN